MAAGADPPDLKLICLGDSAVGKSKLVERYLLDKYKPQQNSTYAVTLFRHEVELEDRKFVVDIWDTAGQERFNSMHPSYYHGAHACVMVFDVSRKVTYKNLSHWYKELRENRPHIPCFVVANKIDVDPRVTEKNFKFARSHKLPFYYVSASDGTNVVRVFKEAIRAGMAYKESTQDIVDHIMEELRLMDDLANSVDDGGTTSGEVGSGGGIESGGGDSSVLDQ